MSPDSLAQCADALLKADFRKRCDRAAVALVQCLYDEEFPKPCVMVLSDYLYDCAGEAAIWADVDEMGVLPNHLRAAEFWRLKKNIVTLVLTSYDIVF